MGVYCDLIRLSPAEVGRCVALNNREDELYGLVLADRGGDWIDLDKAWQGIHFLLNGSAVGGTPPLDFLLSGGELLIDRDWTDIVGFRLPDMRAFSAPQVKVISDALLAVSDKIFVRRYDPDALNSNQIYPRIWETRNSLGTWWLARFFRGSVSRDYLSLHFRKLKAFLADAAGMQLGIIVKYHQ